MKKQLFCVLTILCTLNFVSAQESKFYLGLGLGVAFPGGDVSDTDGLKTGLDLTLLNMGYRFSENWGATLTWGSSGHAIEDVDDIAAGVGYLAVGPMCTLPISDKISWDIKPQYAFSMAGVYRGDLAEETGLDEPISRGSAFIFGNSLVFGSGKGFKFSINLDYLTGKFKKVEDPMGDYDLEDDNGFSKFSLGAGVRYNF